ncbi:hypothetical protein HKD37_08G023238 [Glycine soja]
MGQPDPLGPSKKMFLQKAVASGGSNLARLGELGGKYLLPFPINRGRREEQKCSTLLVSDLLDYSEPSSRVFLFDNILLLVVPTAAICSSKGMIPLETIKRDMTTLGIITNNPPLRCFTFGDFQLSPMVEEFEEILGCPQGEGNHTSSQDHRKQVENGVVGIPRKYLEAKARVLASKGEWAPFIDILALLIFGGVLFPNVDGLVDLAAIDAFLAYHNHKESPVVAMLADLYDTFDRRCEKSNTRIVCCTPALYVWLVSHLFRQEVRHACPLESHRSCIEKEGANWDQLLASKEEASVNWFPRWKEGRTRVLISCGGFPNVPLKGTRGCISYNPVLAIRQLGYPMRGAPLEDELAPVISRGFNKTNMETLQKVRKAWEVLQKKDKELRGSNNGPIGGYRKWLKAHVQGLVWLPSLRTAKREEVEAPEEDKEACSRSKRSLSQRLCETETNMLAIITKYQEELNLATTHEHREQMKADMSALKEQMTSMMEAMLGMRQLMEKNMATAAAVSSAAEADPTLLATTHHPPPNTSTLGHNSNPHLGYNRVAYPYGLPPNYTPPVMQDDAGHVSSPILEGEPPRQPDEVHKDHQEYAQGDVEFYPPIPVEGPTPNTLPQPNLTAQPIFFFTDLVFAMEIIEVGLKRGKFDYVSSTSTHAKRVGATGAKRKEGDTHAITSAPAWVKPPQTSHARAGNSSNSAPVQPKASIQREAPQAPAPTTTRLTGNSNAMRKFPPKPIPEFTPLPMTYEDLLSSLIANQMAVITPGKIYQTPFPKWYDPNATCTYHGNTPGHSIKKCLALKYKVQHLIDARWLTFQEDRPYVKTNPLANHGGGAVNAIESDRPCRSKPLKDVATPRRFIFEALQKGGVIPHGGHKEDSCLLHPGELHNMKTCLAVEELLQRMIDQGRLEVGDEGREEHHICMQFADARSFGRPKPLVIYFTKDAAPQKPRYPPATKPVPFPYQNSHVVPWRYTPPSEREEKATDNSSLSAKVTNITGLSGVTRSGRVFAPSDLPTQPANIKGKAKMMEEQNDKTTLTPNEDIPVKGLSEKRDGYGKKEVSLEEASEFLRIIHQSEFKVIEQLNKTLARVSLLGLLMSSEPHRALLVKSGGQGSRLGQEVKGGLPCHISRSFISTGLGHEGQVVAICEDDSPSGSELV